MEDSFFDFFDALVSFSENSQQKRASEEKAMEGTAGVGKENGRFTRLPPTANPDKASCKEGTGAD